MYMHKCQIFNLKCIFISNSISTAASLQIPLGELTRSPGSLAGFGNGKGNGMEGEEKRREKGKGMGTGERRPSPYFPACACSTVNCPNRLMLQPKSLKKTLLIAGDQPRPHWGAYSAPQTPV